MMDYQGPAIRLWMAFLAGAFVFQENTPKKISYASLIAFLAGAFVFQETTPRASLIAFLAGALVFQESTPRKKAMRL